MHQFSIPTSDINSSSELGSKTDGVQSGHFKFLNTIVSFKKEGRRLWLQIEEEEGMLSYQYLQTQIIKKLTWN